MKKLFVLFLIFFLFYKSCYGFVGYEAVKQKTGYIKATTLNVRVSPSNNGKIIYKLKNAQQIKVLGQSGNYNLIQTNNDIFGFVAKKYITYTKPKTKTKEKTTTKEIPKVAPKVVTPPKVIGTSQEEALLKLINAERQKNKISPLYFDKKLLDTARTKAKDMVSKNYFSHYSPTYGSPFDMMKKFGVTYRNAGENIAGNQTIQGAVNAWMNSPGHRANILSNSFNLTGIGIEPSSKYGNIFVQMFIGR